MFDMFPGGQLGLWVGISIITLMEVVELMVEFSKYITSIYTPVPRNDRIGIPITNTQQQQMSHVGFNNHTDSAPEKHDISNL